MFMRKSTHRRIYIKQGEAYRREIERAHNEAHQAKRELQEYIDHLAPRIDTMLAPIPYEEKLRILIEIDRRVLISEPKQVLFERIRDSILRRLFEANRDYRGDLRQTPAQRIFN
jgi:hypothetical protein